MAGRVESAAGASLASGGGGSGPEAGLRMPRMMYGTAWKKERTAELVYQAIKAGFRGFDTAAMGKHYREDLVGEGIRRAISDGIVTRRDLYIQTKFTPSSSSQGALDSQVPYDPDAPLATQLHQSVESSLRNLATIPGEQGESYLDSLVLHSPLEDAPTTRAAWLVLQELVPHKIRSLGISNVSADLIKELWPVRAAPGDDDGNKQAPQLPAVVQNRFHRQEYYWHLPVRDLCRERGITFQAFWILTANRRLWQTPAPGGFVDLVAKGAGVAPAPALYSLLLASGFGVLDGTTNVERMAEDLEAVEKVSAWRQTEEGKVFYWCVAAFEQLINVPNPP